MSKSTIVIFYIILIFAKLWPVWKIVTHMQTDRQTNIETDKPLGLGEILQMCLLITQIFNNI